MIFAAAEVLTKCVPIVDRLIGLVKARDESRQHLVNDIVAPYFSELQTAYTAYLATLRKTKKMLECGQSFPAVYSEIEEIRTTDLILRDKVREMADAYRDLTPHSDITDFFDNAYNLFGYWNGAHHSGTERILTALEDKRGTWSREFVIVSVAMTIDAAEEEWRKLANQYGRIRMKYLQPTDVPTHTKVQPNRRSTRLLQSIRTFLFP